MESSPLKFEDHDSDEPEDIIETVREPNRKPEFNKKEKSVKMSLPHEADVVDEDENMSHKQTS